MIGVIVNVLAVALGGVLGTVFSKKLSTRFTTELNKVFGVCAIGMGISSVPLMENMPAVILAVVAGTALGLACHLGEWISRGGELMEKPIGKLLGKRNGDDEDGLPREEYLSLLVTAIVLFCSSGTGIYGCLDAGMTGNATVLLSKSDSGPFHGDGLCLQFGRGDIARGGAAGGGVLLRCFSPPRRSIRSRRRR